MANYALPNDIYIGLVSQPLYHFTNRSIILNSAKGVFSVDTIGNELSIDTFNVVIRYAPNGSSALLYAPLDASAYLTSNRTLYALPQSSPRDFLAELPYGTPVNWYVSSSLFAKGYLKSVDRVGKYSFKLTCVSGVGLLDTKMHVGGLYNGATVGTIIANIIGDALSYSIANDVSAVQVYGHLPYDTARNNLHRVLFSCGAALMRGNANTDYAIGYLPTSITQVPSSRVALDGRIDYQLPTNKVEVTEHGFFQTAHDETVTLYDNTTGITANNLTVVFEDAPAYDLQATGLSIIESGVNYAIVSGNGVLTGKMYTHTRQIVTISDIAQGDSERVKRVQNNELVSSVNSRNVARRVLSYYKYARQVRAKIMLENEKCGNLLQLTDAFGDSMVGYLQKMEVLATTVKGATCELVDGYTPGNNGNNYTQNVGIWQNSTWTVPSGVSSIRIVLIGGGQGGQGGYDGENGKVPTLYQVPMESETGYESMGDVYVYYNGEQDSAQGGDGGVPGDPGKVAIYDVDVAEGTTLTVTVGRGGNGGARNGGIGANGTPTTISGGGIALSSANGTIPENGYYYRGYGLIATKSDPGIRGGNGGLTDTNSLYARYGYSGLSGGNVEGYDTDEEWYPVVYQGGIGGSGYRGKLSGFDISGSGGGGGGAAHGNDGGAGGTATFAVVDASRIITTGAGGDGADAIQPLKANIGNGGHGGHGGGAGGNVGGGQMVGYGWTPPNHLYHGAQGKGGKGSLGGNGGDGYVIIYY